MREVCNYVLVWKYGRKNWESNVVGSMLDQVILLDGYR